MEAEILDEVMEYLGDEVTETDKPGSAHSHQSGNPKGLFEAVSIRLHG